jgi:hypothetical protein
MCALILFCAGALRMHYTVYVHNKTMSHITSSPATFQGVVYELEEAHHKQYRYTLRIAIDQEGYPWQLQCYCKYKPHVRVGDTIELRDVKISTKVKNSFAQFLLKEGLHATAFVSSKAITLLHRPYFNMQSLLHDIKYRILKNITRRSSSQTAVLIAAIFFGNRLYVKEDYAPLKKIFCHWGILHFLARSGLHLVIFILLLQLLLRWIPIAFLIKQLLFLILCLIYTALSWHSISFARALWTFVWYKMCHIIGFQVNMVHILVLLSSIFLLYNPMLIFFLDFQLSFAMTFVLAVITQYLPQ